MFNDTYVEKLFYVVLAMLGVLILLHFYAPLAVRLNALLGRLTNYVEKHHVIAYGNPPLSHVSRRRLRMVRRKILVLDMDETLITTYRQPDKQETHILPDVPCDFCIRLGANPTHIRLVYKRPYVDLFLDTVVKWYDVLIFTAAEESYARKVLDTLDNGRGILNNRLYRQHCIDVHGVHCKFLSDISSDLGNILIIDNSYVSCALNFGNSIHIKSFRRNQRDKALLNLLPFLDALRFVKDVRSVLKRKSPM